LKHEPGRRETPSIQSLERGIAILEMVARSSEPASLGALAELLQIDRSSAFRLANTLRRRGFLSYKLGRKAYTLGPSVWRLSHQYDWGAMLIRVARDRLKDLAVQTAETVHLAIREGSRALFIDHAVTNHVISVAVQTGERVPLHCTAHGKALLSDCDKADLKDIFGSERLESYTRRTINSIDRLLKACKQTRVQGYATDNGEYQESLRCLAAPIRAERGIVVAAIGISAPLQRFGPRQRRHCALQVTAAAQRISERLAQELNEASNLHPP
jgi:IclR family transcriptional regulator, acetate operon repressor